MSKDNYLGDLAIGRNNNLDIIRFLLATWVIFFHSFSLSIIYKSGEPYRVMVFFIVSGYFITLSYGKNKSIIHFIKGRLLRIYPGLFFLLVVTVFLIGPLATSLTLRDYFLNGYTYKYFEVLFLIKPGEYTLPGLYESNIYKDIVNGSLWTIQYEILFYILTVILGISGNLKKQSVFILFLISLLFSYLPLHKGEVFFELLTFYLSGSLLFLYRFSIPINKKLAFISLILFFIGSNYFQLKHIFVFMGSYLVMFIIFYKKIHIPFSEKLGNYSYSLYLFGFPIQQTVTYFFGGEMNPLINFIISFPITLLMAFVSWNLVEKRFMALKSITLINREKTISNS
jgi:peptidoglycan/LPS O-acetylase OafA/YrhL